MNDDRPPLPPGLALAWGVKSPGRRGPKPTHSVEKVVQAAIELADAHGLAAISLPKVAARIGVTANALYAYVDSKEELLVLVRDAGWGAPPDSIRRAPIWREAAIAWTRAAIDHYRVRPWLLEVPVPGAPMTPNLLRWLEALLASMHDTGMSSKDRLGCALLLDGYAYSTASIITKVQAAATPSVQSAAVLDFLLPRLRTQGFPVLAAMLSSGAYDDTDTPTTDDVEFGLHRILDGIEALIRSLKPDTPQPRS
jgi:AcrR family transcriptional regulator